MVKQRSLALVGLLAFGTVGVVWAAGDWSSARSKVDEFKREQQDLKKMTPEETRKIVTAICEAEEDQRRDVGRDISDRVKNTVSNSLDRLERTRNDANKLLDEVLADASLSSNHSDAQRAKEEVKERWEMIDRMTRSLRGANHPVVSFMINQGQRAHDERQATCHAKEITLNDGRADCAMATGETCTVIELKPDNSRSISKGRDQYQRYVKELNDELKKADSSIIKKLIEKSADFGKCKRFEGRVDCYKLCPSIDEDGNVREQNADWRKDCS